MAFRFAGKVFKVGSAFPIADRRFFVEGDDAL